MDGLQLYVTDQQGLYLTEIVGESFLDPKEQNGIL